MYVDSGYRDIQGGLATISKVIKNRSLSKNHCNYIMITVKEHPWKHYNWKYLKKRQYKYLNMYKGSISYYDPDLTGCSYWKELKNLAKNIQP